MAGQPHVQALSSDKKRSTFNEFLREFRIFQQSTNKNRYTTFNGCLYARALAYYKINYCDVTSFTELCEL